MLAVAVEPKKLQFLHDLIPQAKVIGVMVNPGNANAPTIIAELQTAAKSLGVELPIVKAAAEGEFRAAFDALIRQRAEGLVVAADPFFNSQRETLVALATQHALPAAYEFREFAAAGGLMSYGTDLADSYRQVGVYAGRILKGEKPADLPVVQPTRFQLVINRKAAATLGLTVPPTMLVVADEVIE
jgi:putative ABC transport system substrate-binding protein